MHVFKGFDDWIEVFAGGWQTDSQGRRKYWSEEELDQIVSNHNAEDPFPAVIGHPKTDDPAYGWGAAVKRAGMKILAKFSEVEPQFENMVKAGRFKKRSAAIGKGENGYYLRHVGWLGAAPPAVEGLTHPTFSDEAEDVFEFVVDWRTPSFMKRMQRSIREFAIAQFGIEIADKFFPEHMIDEAEYLVDDAKREPNPNDPDFAANFSQHDDGDPAVTHRTNGNRHNGNEQTFTQADIDAAVTAERERLQGDLDNERRERRRQEFVAFVDGLNIPPALSGGMAEFMLQLDDAEGAQFEFTAGDDKTKKKQTPLAWFKDHINQFKGKFEHLFDEQAGSDTAPENGGKKSKFTAPEGYTADPESLELHGKALEYQRQHEGVSYIEAVQAVQE